jgi:hypothetical protein
MGVGGGYGQVVVQSNMTLDEKSSTSCALAAGAGQVLLAWTGSDYRINILWSADGASFGGKRTLEHRSSRTVQTSSSSVGSDGFSHSSTSTEPLAPALAVAHRGRFMAWTGTDGRLNVWGADLPPPAQAVLPERTAHPPALAPWGDELAVAWTGTDRRVNVAWTQGGVFGPPVTLGQTSSRGPALAGLGGELAVAWTGTDARLNVLATRGGAFGSPLVLGETSRQAPALGAVDGELVIAWTGTDRRLNLKLLGPGAVSPAIVPATTGSAPALCAHDGGLVLAWTGSDRRLNIARLHLHPA